jgi:hypothetical protein
MPTKRLKWASQLLDGIKWRPKCTEYANLQREAQLTLQTLSDLTRAMLDAFHNCERDRFVQLDKKLEASVGRKERMIRALRHHVKEYKWIPCVQ